MVATPKAITAVNRIGPTLPREREARQHHRHAQRAQRRRRAQEAEPPRPGQEDIAGVDRQQRHRAAEQHREQVERQHAQEQAPRIDKREAGEQRGERGAARRAGRAPRPESGWSSGLQAANSTLGVANAPLGEGRRASRRAPARRSGRAGWRSLPRRLRPAACRAARATAAVRPWSATRRRGRTRSPPPARRSCPGRASPLPSRPQARPPPTLRSAGKCRRSGAGRSGRPRGRRSGSAPRSAQTA